MRHPWQFHSQSSCLLDLLACELVGSTTNLTATFISPSGTPRLNFAHLEAKVMAQGVFS